MFEEVFNIYTDTDSKIFTCSYNNYFVKGEIFQSENYSAYVEIIIKYT